MSRGVTLEEAARASMDGLRATRQPPKGEKVSVKRVACESRGRGQPNGFTLQLNRFT